MKITIESYKNGEIEVKLNWNGKDYIEKWEDGGTYCFFCNNHIHRSRLVQPHHS